MHLRLIVLCLAITAATLAQEQNQRASTVPSLPYHCAQDADIDPMRRAIVETAATRYLQTVLSGDPGAAWDTMTLQAQNSMSRERFVFAATSGPIASQPRNATLRHTFLIHVIGTPAAGARIICGDTSDPVQTFRMAVAPVQEQAYALISADTTSSGFIFTLWLIREGAAWKVNDFAYNTSTLAGRDALQLWRLAREQHQQQHDLNATLLYAAAAQIANRGPNLSLGFADAIATEQASIPKPKELSGNPPYPFEERGKTFQIRSIGVTDAGDSMYLGLSYDAEPWKSNKQVEAANQELISLIKKRFPEYSSAFGGLIVQAVERGTGRTYATPDHPSSRP